MLYYLTFIVMGYILGSILFAPLFGKLIAKKDIIRETKDQNPGTANAFMQGGMLCGVLTLVCDMGKGFVCFFMCKYNADTICGLYVENRGNVMGRSTGNHCCIWQCIGSGGTSSRTYLANFS